MAFTGSLTTQETLSARILRQKNQILAMWEKETRRSIPQAAHQPHPVLIDTVPKFLDNLSEALSPEHPRRLATDGCTIAQEHGGERARITNYTLDNLFNEYRILRETILTVLLSEGPLSETEHAVIHSSLDDAVKQAALAFTLVLENVRQQFIATLSHDLRGPLTAAKANIEMVLKYPEKQADYRLYAARAIDNIKRIDKMISELLDVTRLQAGETLQFKMSECDAVATVRNAREELVTVYGDRFVFKCDYDVFSVWWNCEAIYRVVENLASNAVKYGSSHTPITIELQISHERVVLTVHNEGSPIPPEEQETLFKAFKRRVGTKNDHQKGWGLGLAFVRGVAEGHGGSIIVESTLTCGSTFGIDIPVDARLVGLKN